MKKKVKGTNPVVSKILKKVLGELFKYGSMYLFINHES